MEEQEQWARESLREIALEGIRGAAPGTALGIFFKLLILAYLVGVLVLALPQLRMPDPTAEGPHTGVVDLEGAIAADSPAAADRIIRGLEAAFAAEGTAGVMLRINSPGGSPVQARRIYAAMERLRAEHPDIPLYAVAGDMAASGGYYVAAGADRIFADPASLVGSIGVIMGGFGYTEAMEKLGVERRLYTAGRNKAMLDPFSESDPAVESHVSAMLDEIHEQFIDAVRKGRGDRLAESEELFSGLIWTGERALALGLVDELATPEHVAAEVIGTERTIDYTPRGGLIERITRQLGSTTAAVLERLTRPSTEW